MPGTVSNAAAGAPLGGSSFEVLKRTKAVVRRRIDALAARMGIHRTGGISFKKINKEKVFCIGRNKTGTTSLKVALSELGYLVGDQHEAERLINAYVRRDFAPIVNYCRTAEAFQDFPFSYPYTYVAMDQAFPGSKFILTVRDSAEACYDSFLRHQKERLGLDRLPTPDELRRDPYVYEGWMYDVQHALKPKDDQDLYSKEAFIRLYNTHNEQVRTYFAHRSDDLLEINVAASDAYEKLCAFLGRDPVRDAMPWKNKTTKDDTHHEALLA